jgi:elongation factor 3
MTTLVEQRPAVQETEFSITPVDKPSWTPSSFIAVERSANFVSEVPLAKELLNKALTSKAAADRVAAAEEFAQSAKGCGVLAVASEIDLIPALEKGLTATGKKDNGLRAGAVGVFQELLKADGKAAEVVLAPAFQSLLNLIGDKNKKLSQEALATCKLYLEIADKNSSKSVTKVLYTGATHAASANTARLDMLADWVQNKASRECQFVITEGLPAVIGDIHDSSKDVASSAQNALKWLLATCSNQDIVPLIGDVINGVMNVGESEQTVDRLAGTIFIQTVDTPSLAVMAPILTGGLSQKASPATKRASARIIENMSKLVEEPRDLAHFIPILLPGLEKARDTVPDPAIREVCKKATEIFIKKSDVTKSLTNNIDCNVTLRLLTAASAKCTKTISAQDKKAVDAVFERVSEILVMLNDCNNYDVTEWQSAVAPYLALLLNDSDAKELTDSLHETASSIRVKEVAEEVQIDAEELCKCEFSLAFGNKVLLKKTVLHLHRGLKYGLMGPNDCGKTSLMRAIATAQIDDLPPQDELRTVFVETDIQGELSDLTVLDYIFADKLLRDCGVSRDDMAITLQSVGFNDNSPANITSCVGSLSGGWKMKLALARAMLLKADILLLDEPTNHLDTYNVKWLQDYLKSLTTCTVIVVSHDVKLLDDVCTDIIHFEDLKLSNHRGNLSDFVTTHPEAKCYFELVSTKFSFKFPVPGKIQGINSKGKQIMKMNNISFTYPTASKPQLKNVSVSVCLASRTGIVGVNGAGKSTMIRLLMGELEADAGSGDVWKHPNARVGYIAQHAFHHIEDHLDRTCNEYIRWRYQTGDDREALVKVTAILTDAELKAQKAKIEIPIYDAEGKESKIKAIIGTLHHTRQKNRKKGWDEYECTLDGVHGSKTWVPRKILEENGFGKIVKQIDERIALRETQFAHPLTVSNVSKHMADVGLEDEFSTHVKIGALSTGQKVKVVLGAALWNQPHILILDEPTNYLDRESLGALAGAIRIFEGGVIMISHNSQFVDTLCPEIWHLENNTLNVKGDADWMREAKETKIEDAKPMEGEMVDKFGNTVTLKAAKKGKLTNKEKREKERRRKNRIKNGLDPESEDEEW